MTDRLFTAALTFILLAGGTWAIGSALFGLDRRATPEHEIAIVQLPRVEVTAHRNVAAADVGADVTVVALPRVEVVGRRPAGFAFADLRQTNDGARAARPAEVEAAARVATVRAVRAGEDGICIE